MEIKKTAAGIVASARDTVTAIPGLPTGYSYLSAFGGIAAETIASASRPSAPSAANTAANKDTEATYEMDTVADAESSKNNYKTMEFKKTAAGIVTSARDTVTAIPGLPTGYSYLSAVGGIAAETIASAFRPSAPSAASTAANKDTEATYDMDTVADAESSEQTCNLKMDGTVAAVMVGAGIAVAATPIIISGMGFTATGVAAKSFAAYIMSLYGGAVPAGGVVAAGQAAGVLGVSATTTCAVAAAGAGAGYGIKKKLVDQGKED